MGFIMMFLGLLDGICCIGGFAFFVLCCWFSLSKKGRILFQHFIEMSDSIHYCADCEYRFSCDDYNQMRAKKTVACGAFVQDELKAKVQYE